MNDTQEINFVTNKAIDQGYENADNSWKIMALECVKQVCLTHATFTMNDVRWLSDASPIKTHDKRAMGGIMKTAKSLGWIVLTGEVIVSKVGHKSLLQVWKSKLYKLKVIN